MPPHKLRRQEVPFLISVDPSGRVEEIRPLPRTTAPPFHDQLETEEVSSDIPLWNQPETVCFAVAVENSGCHGRSRSRRIRQDRRKRRNDICCRSAARRRRGEE